MCTCASCVYTDSFNGWRKEHARDGSRIPDLTAGFSGWPRGNPAGPRSSAAAYAAHQRHCPPIAKPYVAPKFGPPRYSVNGYAGPLGSMPAWWYAWNNKASPAVAEPARPATPCKAPQHLPERDRTPEPAVIYAMPKAKREKRPVGRPALPGRRVVIKLEERQIKAAEKLGGGNVAAGIRAALRRSSG